MSAADAFLGWVEASPLRETVAWATGGAVLVLAGFGAWFLARRTTADLPRRPWSRFQRSAKRAAHTPRPYLYPALRAPVSDPAAGCWLDVAEDEPLPLSGPLPHRDAHHIPVGALPGGASTDLFAGWSKAQIERAVEDLIVQARREHRQVFGYGGAG